MNSIVLDPNSPVLAIYLDKSKNKIPPNLVILVDSEGDAFIPLRPSYLFPY